MKRSLRASLEFKGGLIWTSSVRLIISTPQRQRTISLCNLIVDSALNLSRDVLGGRIADGMIRYVALGTDGTPPSASQTQLGAEVFRKAVTKLEAGSTGVLQTTGYIAPYEGNYAVREIGWFAGPLASDTPNSGILVARVLFDRAKTELESWQIVRTDTFGRA